MKTSLKQAEITAAIMDAVAKNINTVDKEVTVVFNAGRKGKGIDCDVYIGEPAPIKKVKATPVAETAESAPVATTTPETPQLFAALGA